MSEKRDVYAKKVQFARYFLVGFERSGMYPPELFSLTGKSQGKAGCWFVHHCFYAFEEVFSLDKNGSLEDMVRAFKHLPHIAKCIFKIAKSRNNPKETVATVIEAGRFSQTKISSELKDYTSWIKPLDTEFAKKSQAWVAVHSVSIAAWLLLLLSQKWWEDLHNALEKRKTPQDLTLWKNSMQLVYKIATEKKFAESEDEKQKIVEHESIKPCMTRMA
ncbi:MAG: hypothetical protein ACK41E_06770 [Deinococcales bacterium]